MRTILETERLLIREFTIHDAAFVLELLNTPTWLQFIGDRNVKTPTDASNYITDKFIANYQKQGFGFYLVALKDGQIPVGMCGLVKRAHLADADIGFAFLPQHTGKGYAFESASACMDFAKNTLKLQRIIAITTPDNAHSRKLLTKLGLHFEKMTTWPDSNEQVMLFANQPGM